MCRWFRPKPPPADLQLKCDSDGLFFQWRAVEGAKHYRYRLIDEDGKRLLQARTTKTSVNLGAGQPGENYTAKVRVKTKGSISKWANATVKCPAAAPAQLPSVSIVVENHRWLGDVVIKLEWKNLPESTLETLVFVKPLDNDNCGSDGWTLYPRNEGRAEHYFQDFCPDTDYYVEFLYMDENAYIHYLEEVRFRTPQKN